MAEFIRDNLLDLTRQLFREHGLTIVAIILGLCILGMLLGSMKRLTWKLFTTSLDGGEKVVNQLFAKPKAVMLVAIVAAILAAGFYLGRRTAPVEVVEKQVYMPVADPAATAEIERLKGLLDSTAGEKSETVNKAVEIEGKLTAAEGEITTLNQRIVVLNNEKAALEGKLAPFLQPTHDRIANIEGVKARIEEIKVAINAEEAVWDENLKLENSLFGERRARMAKLREQSIERNRDFHREKSELEVKLKEMEAEVRRIAAKLPQEKGGKSGQ